jgi:hypothetical protein
MGTDQVSNKKDSWDKLGIIAKVLVPLSVAIAAYFFDAALKERDIQSEYVKLAATALQSSDTSATSREIKKWAFTLLNKTSPVPMPPELEAETFRLHIDRAKYRSGEGFGGGLGFLEVRSTENREFFIYVDNELRATTPTTLNLPTGPHLIEIRNGKGKSLGIVKVELPESPTQAVIYDDNKQQISLFEIGGSRMRVYLPKK